MGIAIGGQTKVFALYGDPVGHSLSPVMQNRAFAACGLDCCYVPLRVKREGLPTAVAAIRALGLGGVNITIPHKESVLKYLDEVDREAELIGAVNTVVRRENRLCGYNTDAAGFLRSLRKEAGFEATGKKAVVLGAGGAARAVAFALAIGGAASLAVINRDPGRARTLAADVEKKTGCCTAAGSFQDGLLEEALKGTDLVVNATPVGMFPDCHSSPITAEKLPPGILVCDLVYNPIRTKLLADAAAAGCRVLNGVGMLVAQGALAFELWTGKQAPVAAMREAVEEHLLSHGMACPKGIETRN
ncbi:MAG: shikimate dehydrogenase [Clostridia bacterium]|jgi:shikimate dehydrogenase|nr:shikimate dehydrogenase [Clostridia bacterium]